MYVIEKEMKRVYENLKPESKICLFNQDKITWYKVTCDTGTLTSSINRLSLSLGSIKIHSNFSYGRVIYEYQNTQFSNYGKYECLTNEDDFIHLLLHNIVQNNEEFSAISFKILWDYINSDFSDPSRLQKLKYVEEYLRYFTIEDQIDSISCDKSLLKEADANQKVITFSKKINRNSDEKEIKQVIKTLRKQ